MPRSGIETRVRRPLSQWVVAHCRQCYAFLQAAFAEGKQDGGRFPAWRRTARTYPPVESDRCNIARL